MKAFAIALASIGLSVAAQFCLRAGMSSASVQGMLNQPLGARLLMAVFSDPFVLIGLLLYGCGAILWLAVLANWEVSKAYPLVGLGFALSLLIGFSVGEDITATRALGVGLIFAGVVLVGRS